MRKEIKELISKFSLTNLNLCQLIEILIFLLLTIVCFAASILDKPINFYYENDVLMHQVEDIELNADGSLPPISENKNYEIHADYDVQNSYWVITAHEKDKLRPWQEITKVLKTNGESSTVFRYLSKKDYMSDYNMFFLFACFVVAIIYCLIYVITKIIVILIVTIFVSIKTAIKFLKKKRLIF